MKKLKMVGTLLTAGLLLTACGNGTPKMTATSATNKIELTKSASKKDKNLTINSSDKANLKEITNNLVGADKEQIEAKRGTEVEAEVDEASGQSIVTYEDGSIVASNGSVDIYYDNTSDKAILQSQLAEIKEIENETKKAEANALHVATKDNIAVEIPKVKEEPLVAKNPPAKLADAEKTYKGLSAEEKKSSQEVNKYQNDISSRTSIDDFTIVEMIME